MRARPAQGSRDVEGGGDNWPDGARAPCSGLRADWPGGCVLGRTDEILLEAGVVLFYGEGSTLAEAALPCVCVCVSVSVCLLMCVFFSVWLCMCRLVG